MWKIKSNTYLDENGSCHWKIRYYSPNPIFSFFGLLFLLGIFFLIYRQLGLDKSVWLLYGLLTMYSAFCLWDIYKYFFLTYIVEAILYEEEIVLLYHKGESRRIPYTEIGFVDFQLHEGMGSRVRFSPHFSLYKKNSTSKILDSVLYKNEYLLFTGEVELLEDYLRIKEILAEKGKHCVEPRETEECFRRGRLSRQARRDIG